MNEVNYVEKAKTILDLRVGSENYHQDIRGAREAGYTYFDSDCNNIDHVHAINTSDYSGWLWGERHKNSCPNVLLLAALFHDLDRFFPGIEIKTKDVEGWEKYINKKLEHAYKSAFIFEVMNDDFPAMLIGDTRHIIIRHEYGGERHDGELIFRPFTSDSGSFNLNEAADILMTSDSYDFLTYILQESYINAMRMGLRSPEKVKDKVKYSLIRLSPEFKRDIEEFRFKDDSAKRFVHEELSKLDEDDFIIKAKTFKL